MMMGLSKSPHSTYPTPKYAYFSHVRSGHTEWYTFSDNVCIGIWGPRNVAGGLCLIKIRNNLQTKIYYKLQNAESGGGGLTIYIKIRKLSTSIFQLKIASNISFESLTQPPLVSRRKILNFVRTKPIPILYHYDVTTFVMACSTLSAYVNLY